MRRPTRHEVNLLKGLVKALNGGLAALVQDLERQSAPTIHLEWLSTNAAVWMAGNGTPMEKISTYLGHTRIDITRNVYAKFQPEHLQDAAAALEV